MGDPSTQTPKPISKSSRDTQSGWVITPPTWFVELVTKSSAAVIMGAIVYLLLMTTIPQMNADFAKERQNQREIFREEMKAFREQQAYFQKEQMTIQRESEKGHVEGLNRLVDKINDLVIQLRIGNNGKGGGILFKPPFNPWTTDALPLNFRFSTKKG